MESIDMRKLIALLLISATISCKKDNGSEKNCEWQCSDLAKFDSSSTASRLSGSWKWTRSGGGFAVGTCESIVEASENVVVTLNGNGTYSVVRNGITEQGTWVLKDCNPDPANATWGIKTVPASYWFENTIPSWCGGTLYLDANYFEIADGGGSEYAKL